MFSMGVSGSVSACWKMWCLSILMFFVLAFCMASFRRGSAMGSFSWQMAAMIWCISCLFRTLLHRLFWYSFFIWGCAIRLICFGLSVVDADSDRVKSGI